MYLTYRFRVKNLHGELNRQARAVNFLWNYCNDAQRHAAKWGRRWLSRFDLQNLTAGTSKELGILSVTIGEICGQYFKSRRQRRRPWLRYRGRKSLGWVPFGARGARVTSDGLVFGGRLYRVFGMRNLEGKVVDGSSFSRDSRGRWFLNLCVRVDDAEKKKTPESAIGIDLGLKELATLSTGIKVSNPRHLTSMAMRLAKAQRARKKRLAANIHDRIKNARRDHLHKSSRAITNEFDYVAVGNVNAAGLAQTSVAKSVLDAGWSSFRNMLRYKAIRRGGWYEEVNEMFTTQVCSSCGCTSGPKGQKDLRIRVWTCSGCEAVHDRDTNAAINILLRSGHRALVEGAVIHDGNANSVPWVSPKQARTKATALFQPAP